MSASIKNRYLIFYPSPGSKTGWEATRTALLPSQLPSTEDRIELWAINLEALRNVMLHRAGEDTLANFAKRHFSVTEASQLIGLNKNTLHEWLKRDLVKPSVRPKSGKGTRMFFNGEDLFRLEIYRRLSDRGLLRTGAAYIVKLMNFSDTILSS